MSSDSIAHGFRGQNLWMHLLFSLEELLRLVNESESVSRSSLNQTLSYNIRHSYSITLLMFINDWLNLKPNKICCSPGNRDGEVKVALLQRKLGYSKRVLFLRSFLNSHSIIKHLNWHFSNLTKEVSGHAFVLSVLCANVTKTSKRKGPKW